VHQVNDGCQQVKASSDQVPLRRPIRSRPWARVLLTALVICGLVLVGTSQPSSARVGEVTMSAQNLKVDPGDCGRAHYYINVAPAAVRWTIDVEVLAPNGSSAGSGFYYSEYDPDAITDDVFLCDGIDKKGWYTVTGHVEIRDSGYNLVSAYDVGTVFQFNVKPRAHTKLTAKVQPLRAHSWKITGKLTKNGEPWKNKKVEFQVLYAGYWYNILAKWTDHKGIAIWKSTPKKGVAGYKLRLHAEGTDKIEPANSKVFHVHPR
jgi:hypothetical protein